MIGPQSRFVLCAASVALALCGCALTGASSRTIAAPLAPELSNDRLIAMAELFERQGHVGHAERAYRMVLARNPRADDVRQRLAGLSGTRSQAPAYMQTETAVATRPAEISPAPPDVQTAVAAIEVDSSPVPPAARQPSSISASVPAAPAASDAPVPESDVFVVHSEPSGAIREAGGAWQGQNEAMAQPSEFRAFEKPESWPPAASASDDLTLVTQVGAARDGGWRTSDSADEWKIPQPRALLKPAAPQPPHGIVIRPVGRE